MLGYPIQVYQSRVKRPQVDHLKILKVLEDRKEELFKESDNSWSYLDKKSKYRCFHTSYEAEQIVFRILKEANRLDLCKVGFGSAMVLLGMELAA